MADTSAQAGKAVTRGANPNTDYKVHYLRCKDKFDRVTAEQADFRANITRASLKHQKLRDEINFLLDAIASKQEQRIAGGTVSHRTRAASPRPLDVAQLYTSATSEKPARLARHDASQPADGAGRGLRGRSTQSPPPAGGYKRPRPPSTDPDSSLQRVSERSNLLHDEHRAADPYADAASPDQPAHKRARNH